ncbi:MAG: TusE/DsrC/DsvC family sulfur relay protein [Gammaproteobacteria bacterium]
MKTTQFNEDGFLVNFNEWNEAIAQQIASLDGLGNLSKDHYEVLRCLREHYYQTGAVSPVRVICHESHLGPHCITDLFTSKGVEAWKIAGLPDPGEELKSYM